MQLAADEAPCYVEKDAHEVTRTCLPENQALSAQTSHRFYTLFHRDFFHPLSLVQPGRQHILR